MHWLRWVQPRNPRFWVFVLLNALNTGLAWLLRTHELSGFATALVAGCAVLNAALGWVLLRSLWQTPMPQK